MNQFGVAVRDQIKYCTLNLQPTHKSNLSGDSRNSKIKRQKGTLLALTVRLFEKKILEAEITAPLPFKHTYFGKSNFSLRKRLEVRLLPWPLAVFISDENSSRTSEGQGCETPVAQMSIAHNVAQTHTAIPID